MCIAIHPCTHFCGTRTCIHMRRQAGRQTYWVKQTNVLVTSTVTDSCWDPHELDKEHVYTSPWLSVSTKILDWAPKVTPVLLVQVTSPPISLEQLQVTVSPTTYVFLLHWSSRPDNTCSEYCNRYRIAVFIGYTIRQVQNKKNNLAMQKTNNRKPKVGCTAFKIVHDAIHSYDIHI